MYSVKELKTPQQRLKACLVLACVVHLACLMSFHFPMPEVKNTSTSNTLDLLLIPIEETSTKKSKAKTVAPQQDARIAIKGKDLKLAGSTYKSQNSLFKPIKSLKKRTISASHHEPKDAEYLARWQAYIEDVGNAHYPQSALNQNLKGSLRLMVAVNKDGSLHEIDLRHSSGVEVLDKAAIHIVKQAAPFEPLPDEISKEVDVLEIIRTWQFRGKFSANS